MLLKKTLSERIFQNQNTVKFIGNTVIGSILMAISAYIIIPIPYVPITAQTLMFLFISFNMGIATATSVMILYILEGIAGFPVFSKGASTLLHLAGPSGGYLWGMIPAAFTISSLSNTNINKSLLNSISISTIGISIIFIFGLIQLSLYIPKEQLLNVGLYPFLIGELVKIVAVSLIISKKYK